MDHREARCLHQPASVIAADATSAKHSQGLPARRHECGERLPVLPWGRLRRSTPARRRPDQELHFRKRIVNLVERAVEDDRLLVRPPHCVRHRCVIDVPVPGQHADPHPVNLEPYRGGDFVDQVVNLCQRQPKRADLRSSADVGPGTADRVAEMVSVFGVTPQHSGFDRARLDRFKRVMSRRVAAHTTTLDHLFERAEESARYHKTETEIELLVERLKALWANYRCLTARRSTLRAQIEAIGAKLKKNG